MSAKKVRSKKENKVAASEISKETGIPQLVADILTTRDLLTPEDAMDFLSGKSELDSPFIIEDIERAAKRIQKAVDDSERICVYGDYDCDGVCASAILLLYLTDMGANVTHYIPHRSEGYGLNNAAIEKLKADGVGLLITVDNGITSIEEVEFANSLGIDVVITDHHQPKDKLPNAFAVVDPHRHDCPSRFKHLCGAGVAFKLLAAMEDGFYDMILENYGDILAVATIGDIVNLVDENRFIVKNGLELLGMTHNIGLMALIDLLNLNDKPIDARSIAFMIVPRINVAGRLENANIALELLMTEDEERAYELAHELCEINNRRKSIQETIQKDIELEIQSNPRLMNDSVLVLSKEGWNHGVIGITASKIVEKYSKPCFLLEEKSDSLAVGSGRGVEGISLFDLLCHSDDLLLRYGGHTAAAGLSVDPVNLPELRKRFNSYVSEYCKEIPIDEIVVDKTLDFDELTVQNVEGLKLLEPFGCGNEEVVFMLEKCRIGAVTPIGGGKHLRIGVQKGGKSISALLFGTTADEFAYSVGDEVDMVVTAEINEYNGKVSVSVKIKHIRLSKFDEETFFKSMGIYDKMMRLDGITESEKEFILPGRDEIAAIYKVLLSNPGYSRGYDYLAEKTNSNYAHIRYGILILKEQGLINIVSEGGSLKIDIVKGAAKVNLDNSGILQRLRKFKFIA